MVPLEKEMNIEVLRQYSILATREVEVLRQVIAKLEATSAESAKAVAAS